ncbi:MAG TPA: hypothetical protein VFI39_09900, partial [Gemmatimonadales bacterium]|nr:hypothetical protein [Gemmatimonadales bacterium]
MASSISAPPGTTSSPRVIPVARSQPSAAPPFSLVGGHFAVSLFWLLVGAIGLVLVAPDLARGNFLAPHVFSVVHAFTLGVITTTIFGVLHQFLPMALGHPPRSVRAGYVALAALAGGTALLVTGFWFWAPALQGIGWTLIFIAIGVHEWNLSTRKHRPPEHRVVRLYIWGGHGALGLALLLGGARVGETLGWWTTDRIGTIAAHFHLAALGFATLTAIGVGSRMIPMFLVSHGTPQWPLRFIGPLVLAGLVIFTAGEVWRVPALGPIGGILLAAGAVLYLHLSRGYFSHRLRRHFDPPTAHMAAAHLGLLAATVVGIALLLAPRFDPRLWTAYALLAILGWLLPLIFGILYKVLTHLTWIHLHGRHATGALPTAAAMLDSRSAWASLGLLSAG